MRTIRIFTWAMFLGIVSLMRHGGAISLDTYLLVIAIMLIGLQLLDKRDK